MRQITHQYELFPQDCANRAPQPAPRECIAAIERQLTPQQLIVCRLFLDELKNLHS
jgi:hypothetical protein